MFRKCHRYRKTLPVITGILTFALICLVILPLIACDATESSLSTSTSATSSPTEEHVNYPWMSMIAREGYLSPDIEVDGYFLEIYFDLGREVTTDDAYILRDEVRLQDKDNNVYEAMSYSTSGGVSFDSYDAEGNLIYSWSAEQAFGLSFVVESKATDFTLVWSGYPPLDIGNPFDTEFIMDSE